MSVSKAGAVKLTMTELGVSSQLAYVNYLNAFHFMPNESGRDCSIADAAAAEKLQRPASDFGLWLHIAGGRGQPDRFIYARRVAAVQHSRAALNPSCQPPKKPLSAATASTYPPVMHDVFERVAARGVAPGPTPMQSVDAPRAPVCSDWLIGANHEMLQSGDAIFWRANAKERAICDTSALPMRRMLARMQLRDVVQLHMLGEPRGSYEEGATDGPYARHMQQTKGSSVVPLNEDTCPLLSEHYVHDARLPLLVSSQKRAELLFVPSVLSLENLWCDALSPAERKTIRELSRSCTSVEALLSHRLNEHYTVQKAIIEVGGKKQLYFHNCVHLRWTCQSVGGCVSKS